MPTVPQVPLTAARWTPRAAIAFALASSLLGWCAILATATWLVHTL